MRYLLPVMLLGCAQAGEPEIVIHRVRVSCDEEHYARYEVGPDAMFVEVQILQANGEEIHGSAGPVAGVASTHCSDPMLDAEIWFTWITGPTVDY